MQERISMTYTKGHDDLFDFSYSNKYSIFYNKDEKVVKKHFDGKGESGFALLLRGGKKWKFWKATSRGDDCTELIQKVGEVIFIAGGWLHEVTSEADSLSVGWWARSESVEVLKQRLSKVHNYSRSSSAAMNEAEALMKAAAAERVNTRKSRRKKAIQNFLNPSKRKKKFERIPKRIIKKKIFFHLSLHNNLDT